MRLLPQVNISSGLDRPGFCNIITILSWNVFSSLLSNFELLLNFGVTFYFSELFSMLLKPEFSNQNL